MTLSANLPIDMVIVCRLKHFTPVDIPVIFVAEEKENAAKSANNPLAVVMRLERI